MSAYQIEYLVLIHCLSPLLREDWNCTGLFNKKTPPQMNDGVKHDWQQRLGTGSFSFGHIIFDQVVDTLTCGLKDIHSAFIQFYHHPRV